MYLQESFVYSQLTSHGVRDLPQTDHLRAPAPLRAHLLLALHRLLAGCAAHVPGLPRPTQAQVLLKI